MYRLIFKPVATTSPKKKVYKKLIQKPYSAFEGKIIRHINIVTLDPFGYSIADTIAVSQNFLIKAGNKLHVKSQRVAIRNLLLIRQNQPFDSLLVKESERLVRSQGYVRDVSFFVIATSKNSDSVDIFIRELDNWSIIPKVAVTTSHFTINLTDKNFLGFGHESQNGFTWYHTTGDYGCNINYFIPNIRNTYINTTLHYGTDEFGNFTKSFAVDRPFFSPFAKWAAGVNFTQQFRKDSIRTSDSLFLLQRFKFNAQDYWAGNALQIFKGNTENNRTTNFISTVRFLRIRYLEKPIEMFDTQHMFSNEDFYLAGIGISTRKYVQDKFIFNYGITEDVPIGKVYSLTGGYQEKNNTGRLYLGARISFGNYYPWGYLSSDFEYGTFFRASHVQQGMLSVSVIYFTGLIELGKWKFRQFATSQVTIGINRFPNDSLTLNEGYGLDGFNSSALSGTSRLLFTLQTQSYTPWNFIGFRFGPYLVYSLGMLGDAKGFKNSSVYSQIGLGVLIKNESLVLNTFQISIAFYPLIPGIGQNVFKINSFKTTDFGFRDFEIGKPDIMVFQ
ncbi:MAG: hypothetical protein NT175_05070 [Bacteroidetes bacterium]|nr:hypothetical protein [Bacteroidota bacterium]